MLVNLSFQIKDLISRKVFCVYFSAIWLMLDKNNNGKAKSKNQKANTICTKRIWSKFSLFKLKIFFSGKIKNCKSKKKIMTPPINPEPKPTPEPRVRLVG